MVRLKWSRRGAAVDGLQNGRFHLQIAFSTQVLPDGVDQFAPLDKYLAHLRIHDQVYVALAVAQFGVGEGVVGFFLAGFFVHHLFHHRQGPQ